MSAEFPHFVYFFQVCSQVAPFMGQCHFGLSQNFLFFPTYDERRKFKVTCYKYEKNGIVVKKTGNIQVNRGFLKVHQDCDYEGVEGYAGHIWREELVWGEGGLAQQQDWVKHKNILGRLNVSLDSMVTPVDLEFLEENIAYIKTELGKAEDTERRMLELLQEYQAEFWFEKLVKHFLIGLGSTVFLIVAGLILSNLVRFVRCCKVGRLDQEEEEYNERSPEIKDLADLLQALNEDVKRIDTAVGIAVVGHHHPIGEGGCAEGGHAYAGIIGSSSNTINNFGSRGTTFMNQRYLARRASLDGTRPSPHLRVPDCSDLRIRDLTPLNTRASVVTIEGDTAHFNTNK